MQYIRKIKLNLVATLAIAMFGLVLTPVLATDTAQACTGIGCINQGAKNVKTGGANSSDVPKVLKTITNMLLYILGAIAVIMLVIGGIRYTTSNGNAEQIKAAKNTIMYAIVGLVVAILAYAIVNWIVGKLT